MAARQSSRCFRRRPGDVHETYADVEALKQAVGFEPSTTIEVGVKRFVAWYREFYGV